MSLIIGVGDYGVGDLVGQAEAAKETAVQSEAGAVEACDMAVAAKQTALEAKSDTIQAKESALSARNAAVEACDMAVSAKNDATSARNTAVQAKSSAETARDAAKISEDNAALAANVASEAKDQTLAYLDQAGSLYKSKVSHISSITELSTLSTNAFDVVVVRDSIRGGTFLPVVSGTVDNGVVFQSSNGQRWVRQFSGFIDVRWFGAIPDANTTSGTGTDNRTMIQAAIDAANRLGIGRVMLLGKYGISGSLILKGNVYLEGGNKNTDVIYALADNFTLVDRYTTSLTPPAEYVGIRNLCLWGFGDRNPNQQVPGLGIVCYAARIGNSQLVEFDNVSVRHIREMGLTAGGDYVRVTNCNLEYVFRDGINVSNCRRAVIMGNQGRFIEDDFIAVHVGSLVAGSSPVNEPSIIVANQGFSCQGIVCMGARNTIIANNELTFVKTRAIAVGYDDASNEGYVDVQNVIIADNVIKDIVNVELASEGRPNTCNAIQLTLPVATVGDGTIVAVPGAAPGNWDATLKQYIRPETYWNLFGGSRPHGVNLGVAVVNNSVTQTLGGLTTISDGGYGQLWTRTGFINPAVKGTIYYAAGNEQESNTLYRSTGLNLGGSFSGLIVANNQFYGFRRAISFDNNPIRQNVRFRGNIISRCGSGISHDDMPSATTVDIQLESNTFDLDPYMEAIDRNGAAWNGLGDGRYTAIGMNSLRGVLIGGGNIFKNCKQVAQRNTNTVYFCQNNFYYCDPANGRGIGQLLDQSGNTIVTLDQDVNSASFGQVTSIVPGNQTAGVRMNGIRFTGVAGQRATVNLGSSYSVPANWTAFVRFRVPFIYPAVEMGVIALAQGSTTAGGAISARVVINANGFLGFRWAPNVSGVATTLFQATDIISKYAGQIIDVVARRNNNTLTLFINGARYSTTNSAIVDFSATTNFFYHVGIGGLTDNALVGEVYSSFVITRAMTDVECYDLPRLGIPTTDRFTNVMLWHEYATLNQSLSNQVDDLSGNSRNATVFNGVSLIYAR